MFFQLQIVSKDKKTLKKFQNFLLKFQESFSTWTIISSLNKKEVITVLKSPHVNKTAQEQFEYRVYCKNLLINSFRPSIFLLTLKKIKKLSFPGITLKITGCFIKENKPNKTLKILNFKNLKVTSKFLNIKKDNQKVVKKYIQLFDCYGEILLKTKFFQI